MFARPAAVICCAGPCYLKFVTDQLAPPRHGDLTHIPGTITREVAARAWTVFNRCREYRKRGSQPLPSSEFPILR
jgi:hypothetical protein